MKIIFIIGASGTGKSSFIRKNYPESDQLVVFDLAATSLELFKDFQALKDDRAVDVYNKLSGRAFFALIDGKDLVVEYCADGHDNELFSVINQAGKAGLRTEVICLTVDADVAWERIQKADSTYFCSCLIKEETLEILSDVLDDYVFNQGFEKICEVGSEGGSISFFKYKKGDRDVFFFSTDETALIEFEKKPGVAYTDEFSNFQDAFAALLEKYPIFRLYPLEVSPRYKREFKEAYQKFLSLEKQEFETESWNHLLN